MEKLLTRRNIFIVLGVILLAEVLWAGWTLFKPVAPSAGLPQIPLSKEKLTVVSLEAAKTNLKVGEKVTVSVNISSDKKTDGTDLIINYDPKLISLETTQGGQPLIAGTIYSDYPDNVLDARNGRVTVSGITSASGGVLAEGLFGTLSLVAQAPGVAKLTIQFSPGSTTDSNVIESGTGKDVLEKVEDLEVSISP